MITKEVVPAFDMLLEELERIIPDLNAQGKDLLDQKQYTQAHELINKAQSVLAFQAKVAALRDEWVRMQVPPTGQPRPPNPKTGEHTPQEAFRLPILQALVELGGKAHCQRVFKELEKTMGHNFSELDWQTMPSDDKEIRWINAARWSRQVLVNDGLLFPVERRGYWEITPKGRQVLDQSKK